MSTNHNRIKVADLETNQPNKILKTNLNGELEFSDVSTLKTENYNALDCTSEGKALDARQGKVLKDIIDTINVPQVSLINDLTTGGTSQALTAEMGKVLNETKLTATIATDDEVQIAAFVPEDNKVLSRSKLFNWWENIKIKTQTISSTWNFSKGLKVNDTMSGNTTEMLQNMFVAQLDRQDNGINKTEYGGETIKWTTRDGSSTLLKPITPNQNRTLTLPNKSGTIAIINDYVKAASGTATTPSLIIPNGVLTTNPQNGAIERDSDGVLWETHNGIRSQITKVPNLQAVFDQSKKDTSSNFVYASVQYGSSWNTSRIDLSAESTGSNATLRSDTTNGGVKVGGQNGKLYIRQSSDLGKITFVSMEDPIADYPGATILVPAKPLKSGNAPYLFAIKDDFLSTPAGTSTTPSLIIPNGVLTTVPQNGAIERDTSGDLYHVLKNSRYRILDSRDIGNFLTTTWRSNIKENASIVKTFENKTTVRTVSIPSSALGGSNSGSYLFKTFDRYVMQNTPYVNTLIPPKSVQYEVFLKGNNCRFSGNQYIRLYSVNRTDTLTNNSIRNNEIAIETHVVNTPNVSVLTYSELTYDNLGSVSAETYREYHLQSLSFSGFLGDMVLANADISIEYRVSVFYEDATNVNLQNANCNSIFYNYSSLFLKL